MTHFSTAFVVAAAVGLLSFATPGIAKTVAYKADLTGAAEVPANELCRSSWSVFWAAACADLSSAGVEDDVDRGAAEATAEV